MATAAIVTELRRAWCWRRRRHLDQAQVWSAGWSSCRTKRASRRRISGSLSDHTRVVVDGSPFTATALDAASKARASIDNVMSAYHARQLRTW